MSEPTEGIWKCKVIDGEAAADDRDVMTVRINVEIADGPDKGRRVTYEDRVNNKSAPYIAKSCKAVGWQGRRLESTLANDIEAWIKATGGMSTVEIKHIEIKNGKRAGSIWGKANSIGRGPKPLRAPSREAADEADAAMQQALAEDAEQQAGGGGGGDSYYDDVPPPGDDNIPFITSSYYADPAVRRW